MAMAAASAAVVTMATTSAAAAAAVVTMATTGLRAFVAAVGDDVSSASHARSLDLQGKQAGR